MKLQKNGRSSPGSRSTKSTLPRVAAALKRFLSAPSNCPKPISAPVSRAESFSRSRLQSTEKPSRCGSVRISEQTIEELDEQLTLSQLTQTKDYVNRRKLEDLFPVSTVTDSRHTSRISSCDDDVFITTSNPSLVGKSGKHNSSRENEELRITGKSLFLEIYIT